MYKVIKYFTDLQDNEHPYNAGDTFPRDGLTVSRERIIELATASNKQSTPLITFIEDKSNQAQSENEAVEPENEAVEPENEAVEPEKQKKDETKKSEPKNSASKK